MNNSNQRFYIGSTSKNTFMYLKRERSEMDDFKEEKKMGV